MRDVYQGEKIKKEELQMLRGALIQLLDFIQCVKWEDEPYFYRPLYHMKNNIDIYLYTCSCEEEYLYELLSRDWKAANNPYTGIPSCELMKVQGDFQSLNCKYIELLEQVSCFFRDFRNFGEK